MVRHASLSLKGYYGSFRGISGALAVATGVAPVLSLVIKPAASILFPPLGEATIPALAGLIALYVATTYVAYYVSGARLRTALMILSVCVACVSLCLYLACYMDVVRRIDIPSLSSFAHRQHRICEDSVCDSGLRNRIGLGYAPGPRYR